jgi:hypothetical protein
MGLAYCWVEGIYYGEWPLEIDKEIIYDRACIKWLKTYSAISSAHLLLYLKRKYRTYKIIKRYSRRQGTKYMINLDTTIDGLFEIHRSINGIHDGQRVEKMDYNTNRLQLHSLNGPALTTGVYPSEYWVDGKRIGFEPLTIKQNLTWEKLRLDRLKQLSKHSNVLLLEYIKAKRESNVN